MPSPTQILTVLGKTLQNAFVSKAKWRFTAMSLTYKEKELANSQLHAYQNDQEGIIQEVELYFKNLQECLHAFTFFNARNALDAILKAHAFNEADEIIVSPYCCVAVPNAVRFNNLKPVFVDIEEDSLSLDYELVANAINPKTKAIILPHIMGLVARDTEKLVALCKEKGIILIEDCAQAIGAKLNGELVGNFGDAAIFSFEQSKTITCISGGMAISKTEEIALRIRKIQAEAPFPELELTKQIMKTTIGLYNKFSSSLSEVKKPWIIAFKEQHFFRTMQSCELEFKPPTTSGLRMDSLTAGMLFFQLHKLKTVIQHRNKTAAKWKKQLREKVEWFEPIENSEPAYLRLPFKVPSNEKQNGQWDYYRNYRLGKWYSTLQDPADIEMDGFPISKKMCETVVNLPTLL